MELESQLPEITALKLTALPLRIFFPLVRGVFTSIGVVAFALTIGDKQSGRAEVRFIVFRKIDFLGPVLTERKVNVGLFCYGGERLPIDFNCPSFDRLLSSSL